MFNFSASLPKYKKAISLIVLFSIILTFIPTPASADVGTGAAVGGGIVVTACAILALIPGVDLVTIPGCAVVAAGGAVVGGAIGFSDSASDLAVGAASDLAVYIMQGLAYSFYWIGNYALQYTNYLFLTISNALLKNDSGKWTITNATDASTLAPTFLVLYYQSKRWANLILVLGFIAIALAYILSLEQYKKLLVPLLITALLINFTVLMVGFMIDMSNVAMVSFVGNGPNGDVGIQILNKLQALWNTISNPLVNNAAVAAQPSDAIWFMAQALGYAFLFLIIFLVVALTLFALSIMYVLRFAWLAILFILSPLAFALRVFPLDAAKQGFNKWWELFMKWTFAGIIATFFLRLGTDVLNTLAATGVVAPPGAVPQGGSINNELVQQIAIIGIGLTFIIIGLKMAWKHAGGIAKMAIAGAATAGLAIATGGASLAALTLAGATKAAANTNIGRTIKSTVADDITGNRVVNWARDAWKGPGASRRAMEERRTSRITDEMRGIAKSADINEAVRGSRTGPAEQRALYQERLASLGEFSRLNRPEEQRQAMENMTNHGMSVKEVIEKAPSLARYNTPDVRNLQQSINPATRTATNPNGRNYTQAEAEAELVTRARRKADLVEISRGEINHELLDQTTSKKLGKASERMSADKVEAFRELRTQANTRMATHTAAAAVALNPARRAYHLAQADMWMRRRDKIDAARLP